MSFEEELKSAAVLVRKAKSGNILLVDFRESDLKEQKIDFQRLESFEKLRELYLNNTSFNDDDAKTLLKLSRLQTLDLQGTQVTEDSICNLAELEKLAILLIDSNQISEEALSALRKKMVGTRIIVREI